MSRIDNWTIVETFMLRHEAELAMAHLEAAGIEAMLADEVLVASQPLLANAVGGIKVLVPDGEVEAAHEVLQTMSDAKFGDDDCLQCGKPMGEADKCPACGWSFNQAETP